ncbi:MAG: aldo/keto reductase [Candidatus Cyclobacteriaceae bacterium M3_2C_046]
MVYIEINDTQVPALGFGTWNLNGKNCLESVTDAIHMGYRHLDTAQNYNNETEVGEAIKSSGINRSELFLVTKIPPSRLEPDQIKNGAEESLKKLQTDYIDLFLIHWASQSVPLEDSLQAFKDLQKEGKIRHLGVSNFSAELTRKAMEIAPVFCNQIEYHPFKNEEENLRLAAENELMLTAYTPLAQGKVFSNQILKEIGEKYQKNEAQVNLRWLIQQRHVSAIPKAGTQKHRKLNFDIFDFELTGNEMEQINHLAK